MIDWLHRLFFWLLTIVATGGAGEFVGVAGGFSSDEADGLSGVAAS